jgi:putative endonuclease
MVRIRVTEYCRWWLVYRDDYQSEKRIFSHNSKKNFSTKSRAPWKLIYYEASLHKRDAIAREKYLKSGMGKRYIKNRLKFFFSENF